MSNTSENLTTACIHAGEAPDPTTGAVVPPIYQSAIFAFDDSEGIEQFLTGKTPGYIYSRYGNPTLTVLEEKMAVLEGAERGLCLASGNAASTIAIYLYAQAGDHLISTRDVYGGTYAMMADLLAHTGVAVTFVESTNLAEVEAAFHPNTKLVFVETPTNPTMKVSDIAAIAELAHARGARLVVDNTFATPINQQPLALGADLVVHSLTKYLNGHSDVIGGVIVGGVDDILRCRELMKQIGSSLNPLDAWLVIRGLKTLAVRIERHNANALRVAEYLQEHPAVECVNYPGLPSHPQRQLAARQMHGFGGMISFVVKGGYAGARSVIDRVTLATRAVSLGAVETLISQPAATSHRAVPVEEREYAGIVDGLIRFSVGIEDVGDIIADLDQALSAIR
jgi:methionine-gamma-lyase